MCVCVCVCVCVNIPNTVRLDSMCVCEQMNKTHFILSPEKASVAMFSSLSDFLSTTSLSATERSPLPAPSLGVPLTLATLRDSDFAALGGGGFLEVMLLVAGVEPVFGGCGLLLWVELTG